MIKTAAAAEEEQTNRLWIDERKRSNGRKLEIGKWKEKKNDRKLTKITKYPMLIVVCIGKFRKKAKAKKTHAEDEKLAKEGGE